MVLPWLSSYPLLLPSDLGSNGIPRVESYKRFRLSIEQGPSYSVGAISVRSCAILVLAESLFALGGNRMSDLCQGNRHRAG